MNFGFFSLERGYALAGPWSPNVVNELWVGEAWFMETVEKTVIYLILTIKLGSGRVLFDNWIGEAWFAKKNGYMLDLDRVEIKGRWDSEYGERE